MPRGGGFLLKRSALVFAFALVLAAATYAFTASNVIAPSGAGQGTGSIAGYTISNPAYTLDVTNPQAVTLVQFTLNAPLASARIVRARVGTSYVTCTSSSSTATTSTWTCPLTGVTAGSATTLRVAAAQ